MRPLALALCFLLVSACAAPVVRKQVLIPAPAVEVARLTRLRVDSFMNDDAGQVRAAVESSLASVLVDGRPYFTVIGVSAPAGDQGKPMQWVDNSKSKARPIRYGAEGLVDGHIDQNDWQDERYSEDRSECVDHDDKGRCVRTHTRHVPCTRRVALFSFTPRVVQKDTGAVLLSQEFTETGQSSVCKDHGSPTSGTTLLAAARARAITRFRNQVAPHAITLNIPLLTEDDSGMNAQIKALVSGGKDFAEAGQTDKACTLWRNAAGKHEAGFALPYLCGVCAELEDNLNLAEDLYSQAEQRACKPVSEISAALARLRETRANLDKLEQQRK